MSVSSSTLSLTTRIRSRSRNQRALEHNKSASASAPAMWLSLTSYELYCIMYTEQHSLSRLLYACCLWMARPLCRWTLLCCSLYIHAALKAPALTMRTRWAHTAVECRNADGMQRDYLRHVPSAPHPRRRYCSAHSASSSIDARIRAD